MESTGNPLEARAPQVYRTGPASSHSNNESERFGAVNSVLNGHRFMDNSHPPPIPPKIPIEQRKSTNNDPIRKPDPTVMNSTINDRGGNELPRRPYRRGTWPPRPVVEDEVVAITKELHSRTHTPPILSDAEPPARGTIEQYPIILEAEVSAEDAREMSANLRKEARAEADLYTRRGERNGGEPLDSGDRRFILLSDPRSSASRQEQDTSERVKQKRHSTAPPGQYSEKPVSPREEETRRSHTAPRPGQSVPQDSVKRPDVRREETRKGESRREETRRRLSPPPLERRRSRQDLPSLQTKLAPQTPSFNRSSSAYASAPSATQSTKQIRTPSADYPPAGRAKQAGARDYFDTPTPGRPQNSSSQRLETPVTEKRRSGGTSPRHSPRSSRASTPVSEKRWSGGENLAYASANLTTMQHKGNDGRHLTQTGRVERDDRANGSRTQSTASSEQYYLSSDDSLDDSSDSDNKKKRGHHRKHRHTSSLRPNDRHHRERSTSKSNRASLEVNDYHSRRASPRASPRVSPNGSPSQLPAAERGETNQEPRRLSARSVSPMSMYGDATSGNMKSSAASAYTPRAPATTTSANGVPQTSLPLPIPARIDLHSPGETRRTPTIPHYDDESVDPHYKGVPSPRPIPQSMPRLAQNHWQPAPFKPGQGDELLERPKGSFRRYSEDVEAGVAPRLPDCPRTTPMRGYMDWLTLPKCVGFNVCPTCFAKLIASTNYRSHFVPAPIRSPNEEVVCDFGSQPWYRIAWLLSLKEQRRTLDFIYGIADVNRTESPCLGKNEANQHWYSILDPKTGAPVKNFDVCSACTLMIEALLPNLKGLFIDNTNSPAGKFRICDMRFDSKRFVHYFDALEFMSENKPHPRRGLDTSEFVSLAKLYASIGECPASTSVTGASWWVITQLPEFTVCEECFGEVVRPKLLQQKAIPAMFKWKERDSNPTSCQLYSERMRAHFGKAVEGNDYKHLAVKARDRKAKEMKWKRDVEALKKAVVAGKKGAREDLAAVENDWQRWQ